MGEPSQSSQDSASPSTADNPTRSTSQKLRVQEHPRERLSTQQSAASPPDTVVFSDGRVSNASPMNQSSIPTAARGLRRRTSDNQSQRAAYLDHNDTSSTPAIAEHGFPPTPEHLSEREKRQPRQMEEFDTIVVRGRGTSGAGADSVSSPSTSHPPSIVSRRNSGIGVGSGGASGRSSRNSVGRNVNMSMRAGKASGDLSMAGGSAGGSVISGPGEGPSHLTPPSSHYPRQATATIPPSSLMDYRLTTQGDLTNSLPSGPQEGVMKMIDNRNSTPQWSETKTKAGKERKRLPLACIACRRKKIRCSGEKPACKHCLRSRVPCVYKQSARKAAPRTDYMAMLDRRLKRMEERLIKCIPKEDASAALAASGRSVLKPPVYSKKRSVEEAFAGKELDEWFSKPAMKTVKGNDAEKMLAAPQGLQTDRGDDGSRSLPPLDLQIHLAEVYFEYLYGQAYFLLHKPSFMRQLRGGKVPPVLVFSVCAVASRFSNDPAVRHVPRYLAGQNFAAEATRLVLANFDNPNMIIVTSLLLLGLHALGTMQGGKSWSFGGMATRMAHALSLHKEPEDPVPRKRGTANPLGESTPPYFAFMDKELIRRVMWACFTMDCFTSSGTQRLGMTNESDIEIQLPMIDRDLDLGQQKLTERLDGSIPTPTSATARQDNLRDNMGVAAYMIRIIALFRRVTKYLNMGGKEKDLLPRSDPNSQFAKLNQQILDFAENLPERLHYTEENLQTHAETGLAAQFLFLHIAYHHLRLCLHQYAVPSGPQDVPEPQNYQALEIALDAATRVSLMLAKAAENGYRLVAPFMGYCAFTSSFVHLVRAFSEDGAIRDIAKKHLGVNMKYLGQMKNYWGFFQYIIDTIKRQHAVFREAILKGNHSPHTMQVLQYGDWFTKYPKGASVPNPDNESQDNESQDISQRPIAPPRIRGEGESALNFRLDLLTAEEYFARYGTASKPKAPPPTQKAAIQRPAPVAPPPRKPPPQPQTNSLNFPVKASVPINSPTASSPPVPDLDGKLDPQLRISMPPPLPQSILKPAETFVGYGDQRHISPAGGISQFPMAAGIPNISPSATLPPVYTNFIPQAIMSRSQLSPEGMVHHIPHQHQSPVFYPYSPVTGPPPINTPISGGGLWGWCEPDQHSTMLNPFHDPTSAWFIPFNLDPSGGYSGPPFDDEMGMNGMNGHLRQYHP